MEALLVNRVVPARDYYIAPIDQCFGAGRPDSCALEGFSGGEEVWRNINGFFSRLRERAGPFEAEENRAWTSTFESPVDQGVRGLTPLLTLQLEVSNPPATESIHTVMLQAQIQIQSPQRIYNAQEKRS